MAGKRGLCSLSDLSGSQQVRTPRRPDASADYAECEMGKYSSFERIPRDLYPTPFGAVPPLITHLRGVRTFSDPCAGDGALVRHLESLGLRCVHASDIATGQDALTLESYGGADAIITNPPFARPLMHALIEHFMRSLPTWPNRAIRNRSELTQCHHA